jgi:hypothetical protein
VRATVSEAGQQIEPAAAQLLAERAGTDIAQLRGDLERLMLYAAGKPKISLADAREVVTAASSQDNWAMTNAIRDGDAGRALRELALSLDSGAVPYMVLGQLGYFVREKLPGLDPARVPAAVEALFRTDIDLKSSGGDPRVLLERLVTELCARRGGLRGVAGGRTVPPPRLCGGGLPGDPGRETRFVASRRVAVDQPLAGHLVDERDGLADRILQLIRRPGVDSRADVAERVAQARAELTVVLAALEVLPVRLERGFVTGHC